MMTDAGNHTARVMELFNRTAMEVYEGQQMDMDFEPRTDVTVDEYMEMIRLKTSVLLACACRLGAIMADATDDVQKLFYDFAINLGLAFQLPGRLSRHIRQSRRIRQSHRRRHTQRQKDMAADLGT